MAKLKITEATTKIVELLTPFDSEERQRVVKAALTLLGEESSNALAKNKSPNDSEAEMSSDGKQFPQRARTWIKQNQLTIEQLQQVFHVDGDNAEVIASTVPGKTDKVKTINAYILQGAARLLVSGETGFDDKSARALCKTLGCYARTNHATYMQAKGNKLTGSKDQGWSLTAPGLTHGATLVKEMTGAAK
jgi:hypothetical protein